MSDSPTPIEPYDLPHLPAKKGLGWGAWLLAGLLIVLATGFAVPVMNGTAERARQLRAFSHCRDIIISLKSYAADHDGKYPDGATANDAFRELIKAGIVTDETIFSSPFGPVIADGKMGTPPKYEEALKPGENYWAMTKGLKDNSSGNFPLVFEGPAVPSWPPQWDSRPESQRKQSLIGTGMAIIIGRNDGSISTEKLHGDGKTSATVEPFKDGKNLFELAGPHEILDVAK